MELFTTLFSDLLVFVYHCFDRIVIHGQDSGPGLTPESINRLFDPFYTTKPSGMGMGLSICRSIIEGHGGRVWAAANVSQGTSFQFTLPANGSDRVAA